MTNAGAAEEPRVDRSQAAQALTLFSFFWGAATLFHIASYNQWGHSRMLVFAAVALLLRPQSTVALAVVAVLQIYKAVEISPFIPNHWLFTALSNAGILLAVVTLAVRKPRDVERSAVYAASAPAARLALIVLYFFVVFHKLNADFFDRAVSCGSVFYATQLDRMPFLPLTPATEYAAIYGAIGIEALIPILLSVPRTTLAGILLAAGFHCFLTINPTDRFYNFSAMLIAAFLLFVPPAVLASWLNRIGERRLLLAGLALTGSFGVSAWIVRSADRMAAIHHLDPFFILWNVYSVVLIVLFAREAARHRWTPMSPAGLFRLPIGILALVPVAALLNGLAPYAGLKTESAWAMFANLRTEGDRSNHLLVPASTQIFDYQRDLVQVTGSSDRYLQSVASKGQLIPYFELRRRPDVAVSYVRGGVEQRFARLADDPAFAGEPPWAMRKLLLFRPISGGPRQECQH